MTWTVILDSVDVDEILMTNQVMRTTNRAMMITTVVEVSGYFKNNTFHDDLFKVDKRTQELIQSDPHPAPNTKGKDRQIQ